MLIPEHTRRQVQGKIGEPVTLHTIFYIEGNAMTGRMVPRLIGFTSPIDREFFDTFCSVDGVAYEALRAMVLPVRNWRGQSRTKTSKCLPRIRVLAKRWQNESSPSSDAKSASSP